jgi:tetratricopeptide (TPR) repeat protein
VTEPPAEPRRIGPYRLVARLGAGAMGEVWRALDTRLDRAVAIKVLPAGWAGDPERRARLLREARAAAAIPHANVVTLFDVVSDEQAGEDALIMELVEGRTLADRLRDGPLPLREGLDVVIAVADVLAAAHRRGILHRDIKAANVMLTRDGHVKVLDFGLAKLRGGEPVAEGAARPRRFSGALDATVPSLGGLGATREGTLLGTPLYFSPEQVQGRLPDERSEIFTLGVLAHELVAGTPPFAGATFDALCEAILRCAPPPLDAPAEVREVVGQALRFEPAERHADMAAFAAALRTAKAAVFAPPRPRWPFVAAIAAVLVASVVLVVVARRDPAAPAAPVAPVAPVDRYLDQALAEFDLFYNDKATASLRAAARVAPDDPRPHAYLVLTGFAADDEQRAAAAAAEARLANAARPRDRALAQAAVTLLRDGPAAARAPLAAHADDPELVFWDAELAWRAQLYDEAARRYAALLAGGMPRFRGRIFDHYIACLLHRDDVAKAVRLGEQYAREFPGEADAIGVQATVYAVAGRLDEAERLARDALALHESEDTLAGLAKVCALRGKLREAERLYRRSIEQAPDYRRPLRRAALATVLLMDARAAEAREVAAPCLPGATDAAPRTASLCVFVAALADVSLTDVAVAELDRRAAARPPLVPYGNPDALARILRARAVLEGAEVVGPADVAAAETLLAGADSLFVTYHLPFLASYGTRLRAQTRALAGDFAGAARLLRDSLAHRPADVAVLLQLAMAERMAGDRAAALATVEKALHVWGGADADGNYARKLRALRDELTTL